MTPERLAEVLGEPPGPQGTWERAARYVSAAALRLPDPRASAGELAARLRALPGVKAVEALPNGFLTIEVAVPGEVVGEVLEWGPLRVPGVGASWPDLPRTWENPGFVVRYAHARAAAVRRWADRLEVPSAGFRPELLDHPRDRAVLRVLAELPGRRLSREPGWESYLVRLALAYHDAHEHAPAVPMGDAAVEEVHTARVHLAQAVQNVLFGPERL